SDTVCCIFKLNSPVDIFEMQQTNIAIVIPLGTIQELTHLGGEYVIPDTWVLIREIGFNMQ
ncbi:5930_t:CDS:1, partial [Racocetra fulgida]